MMTTFVGILALAAQWLVLAAAQAANTTCIGNGSDDSDIQNALNNGGTNAVVEICPGAVIPIYNAIDFVAAGQVVQTQGLPTGDRRALLQIAIKPGMGTALSIFQMATPSPYGPEPNSFSNTGLRNLILDGNSATPGVPGGGSAYNYNGLVVVAGAASQFIENCDLRNDRGPGCVFSVASPYDGEDGCCSPNITVTNNVFTNCTGGIQVDGPNFVIANNVFELSRGLGVSIVYNGLGTNITHNTFTAVEGSDLTLAAISLGGTYSAHYPQLLSGTLVTNNHFTAPGFMVGGILLGSAINGFHTARETGPINVTGNTFSGNISFPMAIDTFNGPINITDNYISGLASPVSSFTDTSQCSAGLQAQARANHRLISRNLEHNITLQSNFYSAGAAELGSFFCATPRSGLTNKTFAPGNLSTGSGTPLAALRGGVDVNFQHDGNFVVYLNRGPSPPAVAWTTNTALPSGDCDGLCELQFTTLGNLQVLYNGTQQWQSNTTGLGGTKLVAKYSAPWLEILASNGTVVWNTTDGGTT